MKKKNYFCKYGWCKDNRRVCKTLKESAIFCVSSLRFRQKQSHPTDLERLKLTTSFAGTCSSTKRPVYIEFNCQKPKAGSEFSSRLLSFILRNKSCQIREKNTCLLKRYFTSKTFLVSSLSSKDKAMSM